MTVFGPDLPRRFYRSRRLEATSDYLRSLVRAADRLPVSPAVAHRVASAAVRVLPAEHRDRYREEFRSEMFELVAGGRSRWLLVVYAFRVFDRAWVLRAELSDLSDRRPGT